MVETGSIIHTYALHILCNGQSTAKSAVLHFVAIKLKSGRGTKTLC